MSSRTTNLNLEKPANTDYVDVDVINSNSDKIDTFAGQVLNGDYVQDSNYVHTDNNFTSTLKNKLDGVEANANNYSLPTASTGTLGGVKVDGSTITIDSNGIISSTGGGGGGTTVIANPSGTATAALEKLQVGQTIYSSGGTTVIGNPSGTATADLEKIQIGNSVFKIPEASLYTPTGLSYTVTMEAVASRTQFDCFLTEYEDGTQTAQNDYSFVKAAAGISEVTVGKVKLQNASGNVQVIALADMLQYNGNVFNTNDVIATILLPSTNVPAVSMTIEEVEFPVSWNQIQQSGSKIAEITINGTTTNVYAPSGGGGSTVSVTQKTSTGTNIADITVDGVTTQLFAPTSGGATALNDLSDVNINYGTLGNQNVLQYDSATAKWGNAEIPRNLASQGDVTISSATNGQVLKYNSTSNKWENSNESGGTSVVANPQETATQELTAIQIGETVYSLPSGEQLIDLIPRMSSDTTPSGECSASYVYSGRYAYYGFTTDGRGDIYSASQFWYNAGSNANEYIQYDFGRTVTVHSILFGSADSSTVGGSRGVKPQFSMDGTTWVDDETISLSTYEYKEYELFEPRVCQHMRLVCTMAMQYTLSGIQAKGVVGGSTGGSGHTILNDSGTELAQEDNLQFKGAYVHDDSTNEKTIVEVSRSMTKQEYSQLSENEKVGIIEVIDDDDTPFCYDIEGILRAGEDRITFTHEAINDNSTLDPYTNEVGVSPVDASLSMETTYVNRTVEIETVSVSGSGASVSVTLKDDEGSTISTQSLTYSDVIGESNAYVIENTIKVFYDDENLSWVAKALGKCSYDDTDYDVDDVISTWVYTDSVDDEISFYSTRGGVTYVFPVQNHDVAVKVRITNKDCGPLDVSPHIVDYSTEEQNTGVRWLDGSYVYQKTYSGTIGDTGITVIDSDVSGITIIGEDTWIYASNGLGVSLGAIPNSGTWVNCLHINSSSELCLHSESATRGGIYYVTIKYIKSS